MQAYGGTNIYDSSVKALEDLKSYDKNEYTRTVILMTDGKSNVGEYDSLEKAYKGLDIPIYSITFGNADDYQLQTIAEKRFGYKPSRSTILSDLAAISIAIGVDYVVGEYNKKLYYWTPLNEEAEQALKEREENETDN